MANTPYSKIQSALNKHLADWASVPENVAYENTVITPPDSTLYLELEFSPETPVYPVQGSIQSRESGVWTITIAGLPASGWGSSASERCRRCRKSEGSEDMPGY